MLSRRSLSCQIPLEAGPGFLRYFDKCWTFCATQVAPVVKNLPANSGDVKDVGLIPGLGRSSGGGQGNPLQYSCLENPMDRGGWQATVYKVAKNWTQLGTHAWGHSTGKWKQAGWSTKRFVNLLCSLGDLVIFLILRFCASHMRGGL